MNIDKETLRKKLEIALNNEITTIDIKWEDNAISPSYPPYDEVIVIDENYQKMLDRITDFICQ